VLGKGALKGGQQFPGLHQGVGGGVGREETLLHVDVFQEILEQVAVVDGGLPPEVLAEGDTVEFDLAEEFPFPDHQPSVTFTCTRRWRGPSNSQKKMPCQVPRTRRPWLTKTVSWGPIREALMWAGELPSRWR
jgi:hypothetical protein